MLNLTDGLANDTDLIVVGGLDLIEGEGGVSMKIICIEIYASTCFEIFAYGIMMKC